eukprot:7257980-Prymnesium_polylepis.1
MVAEQEMAGQALAKLARVADRALVIVRAGALKPLVGLLAATQGNVAGALACLAAVIDSSNSDHSNSWAVDVIPSLVGLLESGAMAVKATAAWALSKLGRNARNAAAIVQANAVLPLVGLLGNTRVCAPDVRAPDVRVPAAWALSRLA